MSNFDPSNEFYDDTNKKVLGKFKDECDGKPPSEFVGLRPKMYSLQCGASEKKTGKGIQRAYLKQNIKHDDYRRCLLSGKKVDQQQLASFHTKMPARSAACFGPRPHAVRLRWVSCGFPLIPATRLSHPASLNVILDRIIVRRFTSRDSAEKASGPLTCKPASSSSSAVTGIAVPHTSTKAVSGWGSMRMYGR